MRFGNGRNIPVLKLNQARRWGRRSLGLIPLRVTIFLLFVARRGRRRGRRRKTGGGGGGSSDMARPPRWVVADGTWIGITIACPASRRISGLANG